MLQKNILLKIFLKRVSELKNSLKTALSRQTERPEMWDIFVATKNFFLKIDHQTNTIMNEKIHLFINLNYFIIQLRQG